VLCIIGCGNSTRSDDGVGVYVAQALRAVLQHNPQPDVRVFDAGTGGMDVMFQARGARRLIIVDASSSGSEAGAIFKIPGHELESEPDAGYSLHDFRWQHALTAGRRIFGADFPRDVTVFLIEAASLNFGLELSAPVASSADRVVDLILGMLASPADPSHTPTPMTAPAIAFASDSAPMTAPATAFASDSAPMTAPATAFANHPTPAPSANAVARDITVARGNLYLPREICEAYLPGVACVALLLRDDRIMIVPLTPQSAGGLLLKQRNARGDRVIHAQEFFRSNGLAEDFESQSLSVHWSRDAAALVVGKMLQDHKQTISINRLY